MTLRRVIHVLVLITDSIWTGGYLSLLLLPIVDGIEVSVAIEQLHLQNRVLFNNIGQAGDSQRDIKYSLSNKVDEGSVDHLGLDR